MVTRSISTSQPEAKLTKFLRLTIYNFLDIRDTALNISRLSKTERTNLLESEIAREGKIYGLAIDITTRPNCLICANSLDRFCKRINQILKYVEKIALSVAARLNMCNFHMLGEEIALILSKLPERFNDQKIVCDFDYSD